MQQAFWIVVVSLFFIPNAEAKMVIVGFEQEPVFWQPLLPTKKSRNPTSFESFAPLPGGVYTKTGRPLQNLEQRLIQIYPKLKTALPSQTRGLKPIDQLTLQESERIMQELARVSQVKSLLFLRNQSPLEIAKNSWHKEFFPVEGAWSIAVQGTAVWRGFANVPCAEFQSELIRQAYRRAGVSLEKYFPEDKNLLRADRTASVTGLRLALEKAGWNMWSNQRFYPGVGAILFHGFAKSPGHVSLSASQDGLLLIDNGKPQGRSLAATSPRLQRLMYNHHVFFLPPGIEPKMRNFKTDVTQQIAKH